MTTVVVPTLGLAVDQAFAGGRQPLGKVSWVQFVTVLASSANRAGCSARRRRGRADAETRDEDAVAHALHASLSMSLAFFRSSNSEATRRVSPPWRGP